MTRTNLPPRSDCPIGCALDILGDRWTLLVIRDLFLGKTRYGEFLESPEGIPTNILADRLQRLEAVGLISRQSYQQKPPRFAYELTNEGGALAPVLGALGQWGLRHLEGTKPNPKLLKKFQSMKS